LSVHELEVTLIWQSSADRLIALVAGPRFRQRVWLDARAPRPDDDALAVARVAAVPAGMTTAGPPTDPAAIRRMSAETGLPWTVVVTEHGDLAGTAGVTPRRRTLLAGLALLLVVVIAGAYIMARSVTRELAVARLQSDFVSAVSHEFRTPLTSLHQFTALLNEADEPHESKRRAFYQAQARATGRLTQLVESLLNFGRMEAGAHPYKKESVSITPFVHDVVREFQRESTPAGFSIECAASHDVGSVDGDREALARAMRNLLENAIKYSGTGRRIVVRAERSSESVAISVSDEGLGIPTHEHREIFNKFVRGSASHAHGITGTGIGLAMVQHIVSAHCGRVAVRSAPNQGSTFTILLPACESQASGKALSEQPWRASS
jgi:signal transduction histidine kinase